MRQELSAADFQGRLQLQFCNWARDKMQDDTFFSSVQFSFIH